MKSHLGTVRAGSFKGAGLPITKGVSHQILGPAPPLSTAAQIVDNFLFFLSCG